MSRIELGYSYELGSGQTRIGVLTRPRWGLDMVMTVDANPERGLEAKFGHSEDANIPGGGLDDALMRYKEGGQRIWISQWQM